MERNPVLNAAQAAEYLGITLGTLHNWRCLGKGPVAFTYTNKSIRAKLFYRQSDLDAYIQQRIDESNPVRPYTRRQ